MKRFITAILTFVFTFSLLAMPGAASAWDPFGGIDCTDAKVKESSVCTDCDAAASTGASDCSTNPLVGDDGLLMDVVNVVSFVAGVAAVIIIILASLRFVTSGGSSEDIAGARRTIIYAVVGLIILVIARLLVGFIVSKI